MGASVAPDQIVRNSEDFEVWPENWDSVIAFLACATQWRIAVSFSGIIWSGLDYSAVDVVLRRRNATDRVFDDVCVMERAALPVLIGGAA